jgi:hypothetical protein
MTSRVPKLFLAAVLAASVPAAALAGGCDHESARGRHRDAGWSAPYRPGPAPAPRVRDAAWRERELSRVRAELVALERERAAYHARHAHQPRKLHRYDLAYAERRADLERRWHALRPVVAWHR